MTLDIVIHIGLGKTGTTTIQENFFSRCQNYMGTLSGTDSPICKTVYNLVGEVREGHELGDKYLALIGKIKKIHRKRAPFSASMILSYEYLSGPRLNKVTNFPYLDYCECDQDQCLPIAFFLKDLALQYSGGNIKVIITLRNQPDWLASKYAQHSNRMLFASQKDFEDRVKQLLAMNDKSFLDYSKWVRELCMAVGRENVCVLFTEDMNNFAFWNELAAFSGATDVCVEKVLQTLTDAKNKRKLTNDSWGIRPYTDCVRSKMKRTLFYKKKNCVGRCFEMAAAAFDRVVTPIIFQKFKDKREDRIFMTNSLRQQILSYVARFNKELERLVGKTFANSGHVRPEVSGCNKKTHSCGGTR